jgi:hypothetical protein
MFRPFAVVSSLTVSLLSANAFAAVLTLASGDAITLQTQNGPTTVQCQAPVSAPGAAVDCECRRGQFFEYDLYVIKNNRATKVANFDSQGTCNNAYLTPTGSYFRTCNP